VRRRARLLLLVGSVLVVAAPGAGDASEPQPAFYVVRPDPRLCPSPLCGGYWAALANHARTTCGDGLSRAPRCYVARVVDGTGRSLARSVPNEALVAGAIEPWSPPDFFKVDQLVVVAAYEPVGAPAGGAFLRVRDLGIRCVRAPCYHLRVDRLNRSGQRLVSSVDLVSTARPTQSQLSRAESAMRTAGGLLVQGTVVDPSDAGTILQASRFYLRVPQPRA